MLAAVCLDPVISGTEASVTPSILPAGLVMELNTSAPKYGWITLVSTHARDSL
jgi:hypothetical protein